MSGRATPWGPLVVAIGCAAAVLWGELEPPSPSASTPREPSRPEPAAVALLDGLHPGEAIAGWTVLGIDGPHDGALRIDVGRDDLRFSISVARLGEGEHAPPVQSDLYGVYYGHAHPPERSIPDGAVRAITHSVARRLRATEHDVPIPPGM